MRRFLLEAAALIAAAVLCALVSNALAARERKLALVGYYPNAQKVPAQATETAAVTATVVTPPVTSTATTTASATATIVVPTATTATAPPKPTTTAAAPAKTALVPAPAPGPSSPAAPKKPDVSRFTPHPEKAYVELKYDDVAALHDAGALFLDARRTSVYEQGHIAGARPFSVWESDIDEKVNKLFAERGDERQQAQPIVVYCSGGDCEDSHMLAQKLWGIQFNNVYVYKDGYPDWAAHRAPTRTGSAP